MKEVGTIVMTGLSYQHHNKNSQNFHLNEGIVLLKHGCSITYMVIS